MSEVLHYLDPRTDPEHEEFDEEALHECPECGQAVINARIRALKGEKRCIECSDTQEYLGCMDYSHKTAGILMVTKNRESFEQIRKPINKQR